MTIEFVQILQDMLGDLEGTPEPVEVKLFGDDLSTLEGLADADRGEDEGRARDSSTSSRRAAATPSSKSESIRRGPRRPASRLSRSRRSSPTACSATSRPRCAAPIG